MTEIEALQARINQTLAEFDAELARLEALLREMANHRQESNHV